MSHILLLLATHTYRAQDFLDAAAALGVAVTVGADGSQALADLVPESTLELDFGNLEGSLASIARLATQHPIDAVVPAEDEGTVLAARAAETLGLPHNPVEAVVGARYKHLTRKRLARMGVPGPGFRLLSVDDDPEVAAAQATYPCVLKPVLLSASRGVIRANERKGFVVAFRRIARILEEPEVVERHDPAARLILAEEYVAGDELAVEAVLTNGELQVLALFDKPDPLEGPLFEETLFVTPSRRPESEQKAIGERVAWAARALGLRHGPLHAEVRVNEQGIYPIEIAPRSIGGLCSRTLRFGAGISLEELILRHATGMGISGLEREPRAAGVMMIPIPSGGILRAVGGVTEAETVPGVRGIEISIPIGQNVVPLPEGHRYLGFIFASADTPQQVEKTLRRAHRRLEFSIEPAAAPDQPSSLM
ncbi:MAG: ATP-grasp domain-containing protein [Gemmatimonadota bacterium]|nr:MAG: ATP-grasp domain-containing protein [Gemmatimonadota bacterium]